MYQIHPSLLIQANSSSILILLPQFPLKVITPFSWHLKPASILVSLFPYRPKKLPKIRWDLDGIFASDILLHIHVENDTYGPQLINDLVEKNC